MTTLKLSPFLHCRIIAVVFVLSLLLGYADSLLAQEPQLQGGEVLDGLLGEIGPLATDKNNLLWIGLQSGGIAVLENNQFRVFDRYNTNIPDARITAIFVDTNNVKWFGTQGGFVYTFDDREWRIMPTPGHPSLSTPSTGLAPAIARIGPSGQNDKMCVASITDLWSYSDSRADTFILLSHFNLHQNRFGYIREFSPRPDLSEQEWNTLLNGEINDIKYNQHNGLLYVATRTGLREYRGSQLLNVYTPSTSGLLNSHCDRLFIDNAGNVWIDYGWWNYDGITRYDGGTWTHFDEGKPTTDLVSTVDGRVWFSCYKGLMMFDGDTWTLYPRMQNDPRLFWRDKPLAELLNDETIRPDIHQVLANPLPYRGKKISIVGRIRSSFEYGDIIDANGESLLINPNYDYRLFKVLRETRMDTNIGELFPRGGGWPPVTTPNLIELVGYLEFSGSHGHLGGMPFQFDITEVYPSPISEIERQDYRDTYSRYYSTRDEDEKEICALIEDWKLTLQCGDQSHLISLLHPEGNYITQIDTSWYGGKYRLSLLSKITVSTIYPDYAIGGFGQVGSIQGDTSNFNQEFLQEIDDWNILIGLESFKKYNGVWKVFNIAFKRRIVWDSGEQTIQEWNGIWE